MDFINSQIITYPELSDKYQKLGYLYENKLWHQLTTDLESFFLDSTNKRGDNLIQLYENFIVHFEARLDQVKLATLLSFVGKSLSSSNATLAFFERCLLSRERLGSEASLCLDMDIALVKIRTDVMVDAKVKLEDAKEKLQTIQSSAAIAFSKYYEALTEYKKIVGPPHEYFASALMYLLYTPLNRLSEQEKYVMATDIALAAISSDQIYNFGEVVATPILSCLVGTPNQWLFDLVHVLHKGDVDKFNELVETHHSDYNTFSLAGKNDIVKQKVVLLGLVNTVFERSAHNRQIDFVDIARVVKIPLNQVEWVLMRAMSLNLIRGTIDEVSANLSVTWVQPRVLDKHLLSLLSHQLDNWTDRVKSTLVTVEDYNPDLYA